MKKTFLNMLLSLILMCSMIPLSSTIAFAETGTGVNVTSKEDLTKALNGNADIIYITEDITYTTNIVVESKTLVVKNGVTFTVKVYNANAKFKLLQIEEGGTFIINAYDTMAKVSIEGNIENDGTITTKGSGNCYWSATVTGTGTFNPTSKYFNVASTYIDYGKVPDSMLSAVSVDNYKINIAKDVTESVTVTLPSDLKVGDTVTPTFTNLIDGVDVSKVFTYKWGNTSFSSAYGTDPSVKLTKAGELILSLTLKKPYTIRTSSGYQSSLADVNTTVQANDPETVYVDATKGNDNNLGGDKRRSGENASDCFGESERGRNYCSVK